MKTCMICNKELLAEGLYHLTCLYELTGEHVAIRYESAKKRARERKEFKLDYIDKLVTLSMSAE